MWNGGTHMQEMMIVSGLFLLLAYMISMMITE